MRRWLGATRFARITAILVLLYLSPAGRLHVRLLVQRLRKSNIVWNPVGSPTLNTGRTRAARPACASRWSPRSRSACSPRWSSTMLGTLLAFALVRHRFRGAATSNLLIFLPMATPEVVLGASLLTLFLRASAGSAGSASRRSSSRTSCSASASSSSRSRPGCEPRPAPRGGRRGPLRRRRADVLAGDVPAGAPGHRRAPALLAFSLRFDDYIITNFAPARDDVPQVRLRLAPARHPRPGQRHRLSMFVIAVSLVIIGQLVGNARRSSTAPQSATDRPCHPNRKPRARPHGRSGRRR